MEAALQAEGLLKPGGLAWRAFASAMARQEGSLLHELQSADLLRARTLCAAASDWTDDGPAHVCLVQDGAPWSGGGVSGGELRVSGGGGAGAGGPAGGSGPGGLMGWVGSAGIGGGVCVVWTAARDMAQLLTEAVQAIGPGSTDLQVRLSGAM